MIVYVTLNRHKMGLGIFTMQGFERRNKESKNTLRKFCNMKWDYLSQNLRGLYLILSMIVIVPKEYDTIDSYIYISKRCYFFGENNL